MSQYKDTQDVDKLIMHYLLLAGCGSWFYFICHLLTYIITNYSYMNTH